MMSRIMENIVTDNQIPEQTFKKTNKINIDYLSNLMLKSRYNTRNKIN